MEEIGDIEDFYYSGDEVKKVVDIFMKWYDKNKRDLPWRNIPNSKQLHAYQVWISEIMAQQTRMSVVVTYYKKWMKKFPTLQKLAKSDIETVNSLWSGLGYYTRARNILKSSKVIVEKLNGEFPSNTQELEKLPGIGKYTAGAISSIVFGKYSPVVDGNVKRVLSRLQAIDLPVSSTREKLFWKISEDLVKATQDETNQNEEEGEGEEDEEDYKVKKNSKHKNFLPGDFNQSLMEFGATVCVPKSPKCSTCPFRKEKICVSHEKFRKGLIDSVEIYPTKKKKKKKIPVEEYVTVIFEHVSKKTSRINFLVRRRKDSGVLLAGLLEYPNYEKSKDLVDECLEILDESDEDGEYLPLRIREFEFFCESFKNEYSIEIDIKDPKFKDKVFYCGNVVHNFSHVHHNLSVFKILCDDENLELTEKFGEENLEKEEVEKTEGMRLRWMTKKKFGKSGVSTLMKKVLKVKEKNLDLNISSSRKRRRKQKKISDIFKKRKHGKKRKVF